MLAAANAEERKRNKDNWDRTLVLAQALENIILFQAGKKPKPLDTLISEEPEQVSLEEYRQRRDAAIALTT